MECEISEFPLLRGLGGFFFHTHGKKITGRNQAKIALQLHFQQRKTQAFAMCIHRQ